MSDGIFRMNFLSANRIGKATLAACDLASRTRKFSKIEITVTPVQELADIRALLADCFDHSDEEHYRNIANQLLSHSGEGWAIGNLVHKLLDYRKM